MLLPILIGSERKSDMLFTLLFFYAPVMLGAILGNTAVCLLVFRRRKELGWRLRYAHYLAALLMLPGLVCNVGGTSPDGKSLVWGAWLYPAAFFLAAFANLASLRRDGLRWWLVPIPALNLWLGVVYLTRYLAYLGVPLGLAADGLHVTYSMVQTGTANLLYIFFPIFDLLPILTLPASPTRKWVRRLNLLPAAACFLLLALNVGLLPYGYRVAASWRGPVDLPPARADFRAGVVLREPSAGIAIDEHWDTELARIEDLGARAVNLFLHDDLMHDEARAAALERFLGRLRGRGVSIILTADYPQSWATAPPGSPEEVLAAMLPHQQFLATRFRPDILVPFIEPYGAFIVLGRATYPPEQWDGLLATASKAVHSVAPGVRCAVYLGSLDNDAALYRLVCRPGSPVDVVGFSVYSLFQTRDDMQATLAKVQGWIEQSGRGREHWVFEFGQSPVTMGGELAQSHYIQFVAAWAMRQPEMRGVCVFSLGDYAEKLGLVSSTGRKRLAFYDYQRLARSAGER
jgi:hypothetical protein